MTRVFRIVYFAKQLTSGVFECKTNEQRIEYRRKITNKLCISVIYYALHQSLLQLQTML